MKVRGEIVTEYLAAVDAADVRRYKGFGEGVDVSVSNSI